MASVMETRDVVESLHKLREFSQPLECLDKANISIEKVLFPKIRANLKRHKRVSKEIARSGSVILFLIVCKALLSLGGCGTSSYKLYMLKVCAAPESMDFKSLLSERGLTFRP